MDRVPDEIDLVGWLTDMGLKATSEQALVEGFCARLDGMGFHLIRAAIGSDVLHPVHSGRAFIWRRDGGVIQEDFVETQNGEDDEHWRRSPFYHMIVNNLPSMRQRLDASLEPGRFPLLHELKAQGGTDYIAVAVTFDEAATIGELRGILASLITASPNGFDDRQIALAGRVVRHFAHAYKTITTVSMARTLLQTYLGAEVEQRIMRGQVRRGLGDEVVAVLWYSDLRGFTRLADSLPREAVIALLNAYAEVLVDAVQSHGGTILKFMGDGILAMFEVDDANSGANNGAKNDAGTAAGRALDAAGAALKRIDKLNIERAAQGEPTTGFYLGLHKGQVLFGNIGSRERLDFTVIGPAVNEVARIENICRALDQQIVVSKGFWNAAGQARNRLVSLGRYALRGVKIPQELFTLDPEAAANQ